MREVEPGYFNFKQAAAYVGFGKTAFRDYVLKGQIPKYGPKLNRFRKADLDAFMEDPNIFRSPTRIVTPYREGFTPVTL
ncbi:helix-turn-helix domain-containing protein [Desulfocurvibacter africanus]|uniref:helix-turn-helix domain-containing protein n=1 Tax=Desulfocurvibacter africanus TaxID=873 RepID=UPI00041933BF|nr:helix-turn-helix domain-containing protein [Desulfocurvibacter africanus]